MAPALSIADHRFENEEGDAPGVIGFTFDAHAGMLRGYGEGFWSLRQVTAYAERWTECVGTVHAAGMRVRALVDIRQAIVQSPEVAQILANRAHRLYRPDDRIAMVVANSLLKLQIRRVLNVEGREYFVSPTAAETWLSAFEAMPRGQAPSRASSRGR